ncbi:MAG: repeat protein, partial [Gemmataceae bacterium]|nr:repeat protein [Gemmataceae bacterium]
MGAGIAGDVNGDGRPDLAVGTGPGVPAEVKVFSGKDRSVLWDLYPFGRGVTAGASVALAYVDDDTYADVVVGTGPGVPAEVKVFSGATGLPLTAPLGDYRPFGPTMTGGLNVAAGNDPASLTLTASPSPAGVGSTVTATAVVNGAGPMQTVTVLFSWGDMTTSTASTSPGGATTATLYQTHVYSAAGTYTISAQGSIAYSGGGGDTAFASTSQPITNSPPPPPPPPPPVVITGISPDT